MFGWTIKKKVDWNGLLEKASYFESQHDRCMSAQAWVSIFLNNALTLLYCVAIALAIWKLRNHMDWKP